MKFDRLLDGWRPERRIMFCDEALAQSGGTAGLADGDSGPWAILIGPEGGFSERERGRLQRLEAAHAVRLGPRDLACGHGGGGGDDALAAVHGRLGVRAQLFCRRWEFHTPRPERYLGVSHPQTQEIPGGFTPPDPRGVFLAK